MDGFLFSHTKKAPLSNKSKAGLYKEKFGGVLLSHRVAPAVPSALKGLTAVFGMGTGVSPLPSPPNLYTM